MLDKSCKIDVAGVVFQIPVIAVPYVAKMWRESCFATWQSMLKHVLTLLSACVCVCVCFVWYKALTLELFYNCWIFTYAPNSCLLVSPSKWGITVKWTSCPQDHRGRFMSLPFRPEILNVYIANCQATTWTGQMTNCSMSNVGCVFNITCYWANICSFTAKGRTKGIQLNTQVFFKFFRTKEGFILKIAPLWSLWIKKKQQWLSDKVTDVKAQLSWMTTPTERRIQGAHRDLASRSWPSAEDLFEVRRHASLAS